MKFLALTGAAALASCTAIPPSAPPTQAPTSTPPPTHTTQPPRTPQPPRTTPPPPPTTTTAPLSPPPRPHTSDWRDQPQTPGTWTWGKEGNRSVARFGGSALALSCDLASRTVTLSRPGSAQGSVPITILTVGGARSFTGTSVGTSPASIAVSLQARDGVLDAMAFTRGRFAVETRGMPTLYVPSWPEVSRVIEDCR